MLSISSASSGAQLSTQAALARVLADQSATVERLATLRRINRGSDDPAGLIAAEHLQAEITALEVAEGNASRAEAVIALADSALGQVGELVNSIESSVLAASGFLSDEERAAYQLQIDSALEAIDRIGATTSFGGTKLLDGSLGELSVVLSADVSQVESVPLPQVSGATLGGAAGMLNELRSGGSASLASGNYSTAATIARQARSQILASRAELGAFQKYTLGTSREVLSQSVVELTKGLSEIRDANIAEEAARLVRGRFLAGAALSGLRSRGTEARRMAELLTRME